MVANHLIVPKMIRKKMMMMKVEMLALEIFQLLVRISKMSNLKVVGKRTN